MEKKYLLMSIDDERAKKLADVLGNKSCKKIIDFLSGIKEASETDISKALGMPINTAEYNIKKLISSGLIEKSKNFFWSRKGKKIDMYKLSNKSIIISPKPSSRLDSKLKALLPVLIVSGAFALLIKVYYSSIFGAKKALEVADKEFARETIMEAVPKSAGQMIGAVSSGLPVWLWFLIGTIFASVIFLILNWRKL